MYTGDWRQSRWRVYLTALKYAYDDTWISKITMNVLRTLYVKCFLLQRLSGESCKLPERPLTRVYNRPVTANRPAHK